MGLKVHIPQMPPLERQQGWEARLTAVLEDARRKEYKLGEHDCLKVALSAIAALTGHDHWPHVAGKYSARLQAMRIILSHGKDFDAAFSWWFVTQTESMSHARRGDICKYVDEEPHLGVCVGAKVAVLKSVGLEFVDRTSCQHCWRIG